MYKAHVLIQIFVKLRLLEVKCSLGIYYNNKTETKHQDTTVCYFMPAGECFSSSDGTCEA